MISMADNEFFLILAYLEFEVEQQENKMRKIVLLLAILLVGSNVFAGSRIIRTVQQLPNQYNYNYNNVPPCEYEHYRNHHGNNNNYNNYNNNYRNYNRAQGAYYNNGYYPQQRVKRVTPVNRSLYNPNRSTIYRFGSKAPEAIKPISYDYDTNTHDARLSIVEKNVYGKTFETQNLNLRLDRLERSMFNKTYPKMSFEERVNNLFVNYNNESGKISQDNLVKLERRVFNRTFENDTEQSRISRLEEKMLGAIQQGELKDRVDTLNRISTKDAGMNNHTVKNAQPSYGTCYGGYPPYGSTGWRGALNTLGLMFGGCPTGLSPQVDPYYADNFGFTDGGSSNGYVGNRGYGYDNRRTGTGTGVTILD